MKKRKFCGILSIILAVSMLSSCGGSTAPEKTATETTAASDTAQQEAETTAVPDTLATAPEETEAEVDYSSLSEE